MYTPLQAECPTRPLNTTPTVPHYDFEHATPLDKISRCRCHSIRGLDAPLFFTGWPFCRWPLFTFHILLLAIWPRPVHNIEHRTSSPISQRSFSAVQRHGMLRLCSTLTARFNRASEPSSRPRGVRYVLSYLRRIASTRPASCVNQDACLPQVTTSERPALCHTSLIAEAKPCKSNTSSLHMAPSSPATAPSSQL